MPTSSPCCMDIIRTQEWISWVLVSTSFKWSTYKNWKLEGDKCSMQRSWSRSSKLSQWDLLTKLWHMPCLGYISYTQSPWYSVKKNLRDSWICFDQTFLGLGLSKLFPARENLVSDIPAGDGTPLNLFLQCTICPLFRAQLFFSDRFLLKKEWNIAKPCGLGTIFRTFALDSVTSVNVLSDTEWRKLSKISFS